MRLAFACIATGRLARDRRGTSALEFALIAPIIFLLIAGLIDGARLIIQTMQVRAAAQGGANWALRNGWDPAGVTSAIAGATTLSVNASPAPALVLGCVVSGKVVASAGPNCANGAPVGRFVTVGAERAFAPLIAWPGVPLPTQITAQAQVRIP